MPAAPLDAYTDWECPACGLTERTRPLPPNASRFHTCPKLHMLTAPLVRAGTDCTLVAVEREDYRRREVTHEADDGRAYMNITTRHADGHNDVAVLAPTAQMTLATA